MVNWTDRRNREASYSNTTPVALRRLVDERLAEKTEKPARMLFHYEDGSSDAGYVNAAGRSEPSIFTTKRSRPRPFRDEGVVKVEATRKRRGVRDTLYTNPKYRESQ